MLDWFYFVTYFVTVLNSGFHAYVLFTGWTSRSFKIQNCVQYFHDETFKSLFIRLVVSTLNILYFTRAYSMRSIFAFQLLVFCFLTTGYVVRGHYMFVLYMVSFLNGFIMFDINTLLLVFANAKGDPFNHSVKEWVDLVISIVVTFSYFFVLGNSDVIATTIIQHARKKAMRNRRDKKKKQPKGIVLNVLD